MTIRFIRKSFILFLGLTLASCQSTVDANPNDFSQDIRNLAQKSPPLHRVEWKVCGVEKIKSLAYSIENQCVETDQTMLVWGATGKYKLIPTEDYTTGIQSHLFVESRGCYGMGDPTDTQFYKAKTFLVGLFNKKDSLPTPTAEVKVTQLTLKQKEDVISSYLSSSPDTFLTGISSNYDCQSEQQWKRNFAR